MRQSQLLKTIQLQQLTAIVTAAAVTMAISQSINFQFCIRNTKLKIEINFQFLISDNKFSIFD